VREKDKLSFPNMKKHCWETKFVVMGIFKTKIWLYTFTSETIAAIRYVHNREISKVTLPLGFPLNPKSFFQS
jgi:hypothetical protein